MTAKNRLKKEGSTGERANLPLCRGGAVTNANSPPLTLTHTFEILRRSRLGFGSLLDVIGSLDRMLENAMRRTKQSIYS